MRGSYAFGSPIPDLVVPAPEGDATPEERVREATEALGWEQDVADSAVRALARRQATAGKTCGRCGQEKPFSAFGFDSTSSTGRRSWCRTCRSRPGRPSRPRLV